MPSFTCSCGAKYRFHQESVGKKAKCKKCGEIITLEAADASVIPLADEGIIPFAKDDSVGGSTLQPTGTALDAASGIDASDIQPPPPPPGFTPPKVIIEEPERVRTYSGDLLESLVYMFRLESLLTFLFMWFLLSVSYVLLPFGGIFGLLGSFVVTGWYCAFRFDVVREAAAGEPGLPELTLSGGWVDGIIFPFLGWVGSWLIVMIPALVALALGVGLANLGFFQVLALLTGNVSGQVVGAVQAQAWMPLGGVMLGLFFWPIVILCFALGGVSSLGRLDLIVETSLKTLPVYVLTVLIVYGKVALIPILAIGIEGWFVGTIFMVGVTLYLELIALRAIGLYYLHFKHKFRWSWG